MHGRRFGVGMIGMRSSPAVIRTQERPGMASRPGVLPEIPERTRAVAVAAFPKESPAMRLPDECGEVFADGAPPGRRKIASPTTPTPAGP
jgi:hypothetical protein